MTADAAHVAALYDALHSSHDWGACNCRAIARVAVETLTPLIAAERDALAAENARLRAQVQAVEALRPVRHACSTGVWLHYQDVRTALTPEPDDHADLVEHVRRTETRLETANQELRDTWAALDLALGLGQTVNTPALSVKILAEQRDALAAEVDRCDGCGSSLSRCLRWHEKREGMGKCCPECKHPGEAAGWATLRAERDTLAAEVERWVDAHAVLAREVDELRRALSVDDLAAHDEARAEELAPRITAAMLGAYGLGRDDEAAGNPVRTPLDIVENSLPADVPMSSNRGHDLRERIAQRIDQAWAEAKDRDRNDGGYRDGYLDGLEHAEGIARSTPLTEDTEAARAIRAGVAEAEATWRTLPAQQPAPLRTTEAEVCACRHPVAAHRAGQWGACDYECGCQRITTEAGEES